MRGIVLLLSILQFYWVEGGYPYMSTAVHSFDTYDEFKRVYMEDEDPVTTVAVLLGVYSMYCKHLINSASFQGIGRMTSTSVVIATVPADTFPFSMDECAEAFWFKKGDSSPASRTSDFDYVALRMWVGQLRGMDVTITNTFDFPIMLYWCDEDAGIERQGLVPPGHSIAQGTLLGHIFMARRALSSMPDSSNNRPIDGEALSTVEVGEVVDFLRVDSPHHALRAGNRLELCQQVGRDPHGTVFKSGRGLLAPTANTDTTAAAACDSMEDRWNAWYTEQSYQVRVSQNYLQSRVVPAVTTGPGFNLQRLPADTFEWLKEYFYASGEGVRNSTNGLTVTAVKRDNLYANKSPKYVGVLAEEYSCGSCLNQDTVPTEIKVIPGDMKQRLAQEIGTIFEVWYGGPLAATSVYGVRRYRDGAELRMHLDTISTHVVSAIINIGQSLREEWPLLILDHSGVEQSVIMRPGDLLLYESARLVHGRPTAMKGDYYDNLFIHFMPQEDWEGKFAWV
jgi:hypothetical protein